MSGLQGHNAVPGKQGFQPTRTSAPELTLDAEPPHGSDVPAVFDEMSARGAFARRLRDRMRIHGGNVGIVEDWAERHPDTFDTMVSCALASHDDDPVWEIEQMGYICERVHPDEIAEGDTVLYIRSREDYYAYRRHASSTPPPYRWHTIVASSIDLFDPTDDGRMLDTVSFSGSDLRSASTATLTWTAGADLRRIRRRPPTTQP